MSLTLHAAHEGLSLADIVRHGGVSGAGGAGFPAYVKYAAPVRFHVTNAQESEPGYIIDKWLHQTQAQAFADLYAHLRAWGVEKTVVAAKMPDRPWFQALEQATGGAVLDCTGKNRHKLDEQANPVLFTYTDDRYAYGMETALLLVCAGTKIPQGTRPIDHGFIVQNSETLWNIHQLLTTGRPVTTKFVHVYGETPKHTFVEVPVGTPASVVLADAGLDLAAIAARGLVVVDGGPGWFERVDPAVHVVTRRTNSLLVIDPAYADPTQKDVLPKPNKPGYPKANAPVVEPLPRRLQVQRVRVPLLDNRAFAAVKPAVPAVAVGAVVAVGDVVGAPAADGVSNAAHASIAGVVTAVGDDGITLEAR